MSKKNYRPWEINIDEFYRLKEENDQLQFLLNFAVLAPSSHNSQPWNFSVSNKSISVYIDQTRTLKIGDKENRLLFINIGCAITNIVIAADYYGLSPRVEYLPITKNTDLVAIINFTRELQKESARNHLIHAIPKRSVNREKYKPELPPDSFFEHVNKLICENVKIDFITNEKDRHIVADAAVHSAVDMMEAKEFRKELQQYVKSNITKSKIGIPAFGMGIPTILSLIVPFLVRFFNMDKLSKNTYNKLLKDHTPVFIVISTKNDTKLDWIKSGEIYQTIALIAERHNVKTAVWAAIILVEKYYKKIQEVLKTTYRPQMLFRVGYPVKHQPHSPRLSVPEVLKK